MIERFIAIVKNASMQCKDSLLMLSQLFKYWSIYLGFTTMYQFTVNFKYEALSFLCTAAIFFSILLTIEKILLIKEVHPFMDLLLSTSRFNYIGGLY